MKKILFFVAAFILFAVAVLTVPAVRADGVVHFAGSAVVAGRLVGLTALTAAGGFILETLFSVEFLFACGKHEFFAAVTAHQRFVLIHCFCDPLINIVDLIGCG